MSDIETYPSVEELVARSKAAQKQFEFAAQEQADAAARAVCKVVYDNAEFSALRPPRSPAWAIPRTRSPSAAISPL